MAGNATAGGLAIGNAAARPGATSSVPATGSASPAESSEATLQGTQHSGNAARACSPEPATSASPPATEAGEFAALLAPIAETICLPPSTGACVEPALAEPAASTPDQVLAMLAGVLALPATPAPATPTAGSAIPTALGSASASPPANAGAPVAATTAGSLAALETVGVLAEAAASAREPAGTPTPDGTMSFDGLIQAAAAPTSTTAARETAPTPPPLSMPADPDAGFDDNLGTRIAWMADQRLGQAQIRLNPEHLGPIKVSLQLDGDRVDAQFHSTHVEVRAALEASVPRLRELLGQHGLQLGQADVGQRQGSGGTPSPASHASRPGDEPASDADATPAPRLLHRRLLDEYA